MLIKRPQQFLALKLKTERTQLGLTQYKVAHQLNYNTPQMISNFERGICGLPLEKLAAYAELVDVPRPVLINWITEDYRLFLESFFDKGDSHNEEQEHDQ